MMSLAGAWTMAGAGAAWGIASLTDGDAREAIRCGSIGVGFALVAWSQRASASRSLPLLIAGFVVASLPSTYWLLDAAGRGQWSSPWVPFGVGIDLAAAFAIASSFGAPGVRVGKRVAFAIVAYASSALLVDDLSVNFWSAGYALALLGSIAMLVEPPMRAEPASAIIRSAA